MTARTYLLTAFACLTCGCSSVNPYARFYTDQLSGNAPERVLNVEQVSEGREHHYELQDDGDRHGASPGDHDCALLHIPPPAALRK